MSWMKERLECVNVWRKERLEMEEEEDELIPWGVVIEWGADRWFRWIHIR